MHVTDPLEPPRRRAPELNLPPAADAIVGRAMAKARDDRYATAAEVQRDWSAPFGLEPGRLLRRAPTVSPSRAVAQRGRLTGASAETHPWLARISHHHRKSGAAQLVWRP